MISRFPADSSFDEALALSVRLSAGELRDVAALARASERLWMGRAPGARETSP